MHHTRASLSFHRLLDAAFEADRPWLQAAAATIVDLEHHGGRVTVTDFGQSRSQCALFLVDLAKVRNVAVGDQVAAGAMIERRGDELPTVAPRPVRKICQNGAVLADDSGTAQSVDAYQVDEALRVCLSGEVLARAADRFRRAATTTIVDLRGLLERLRLATPPHDLVDEFARAGDSTGWGLLNAATALARDERNLARRAERERDAERILAAIERGWAAPAHAANSTPHHASQFSGRCRN